MNTPIGRSFTSTANFTDSVISVTSPYSAFHCVNPTNDTIEISIDSSNEARFFVAPNSYLLIDRGIDIQANVRLRYRSGGSGGTVFLSTW